MNVMFWIIITIVVIILGAILTQIENGSPHGNRSQYNDLTKEEIEYDYLQRQKEEQDEEDYYLQQMDKD